LSDNFELVVLEVPLPADPGVGSDEIYLDLIVQNEFKINYRRAKYINFIIGAYTCNIYAII
jgi:hypothetical protein